MEVLVRNAEGNLSESDREYAAKKLGRLSRYFHQASKVEIVHREEKLDHRIEITVFADGLTLRGEEHDPHLRAAIDKVTDKMEGRLRRLKTRIVARHRRHGGKAPIAFEEQHEVEEHNLHEIRERKQFLVKPMSWEEAALQMDLVDYPFFVFRNEETNHLEVLYRRKDGHYGLLHPEG